MTLRIIYINLAKVRRLYDIANILSSLKLIEKVHIRGTTGKKPGFKWIGVDIDSLPENTSKRPIIVSL
jgi:transcription factor E2F7/8